MNKQEFIAELSRLLKVKPEDKQSILEEYENYFQEALAAGELEADIIASLETPAQIAENANVELGEDPKAKYEQRDHASSAKSSDRFFDDDFFDGLERDIEQAVSASEKAVRKAAKTIDETVRKIDFKQVLDKVMDKVDKVVDKAMEFDVKGRFEDAAMRFDQSKVETFSVNDSHLQLLIDDPNTESLIVELVPGQQQLMVKYLPTNLKCQISLNDDVFRVQVDATSIKFSERKRMRIYIPESVNTLTVQANCPLTFNDVDIASVVDVQGSPLMVKKMMADHLTITSTNGPLIIKHSQIDHIKITTENGPVTLKDLKSDQLQVHHQNGPLSLKDARIEQLWITGGNGPKSLKDLVAGEITLQVTGGPLSLKDCKARKISGDVSDTLFHQSDTSFDVNELVRS